MLGAWREAGPSAHSALPRGARPTGARAVGLEGLERRQIGSLSVGQFQRVLFARLLLQDTRVILLDEPFAAVDARTTRDLLAIIRRWHDEGRTVIAALHDLDLVREHFPETLLLADGEAIGWGPTASVMTDANLLRAQALTEQSDHHPHVRAVSSGAPHDPLRRPRPAVRRIRLHAPRFGRLRRPRPRRRSGRRAASPSAHEPCRRHDGPCGAAGRCARLSRRRRSVAARRWASAGSSRGSPWRCCRALSAARPILREDASFASFYLTSLAAGVLIVSLRGSNTDLLHVLFGTILAIDAPSLFLVGGVMSLTLVDPGGRLPAARGGMFRSGLPARRRRPRVDLSPAFPVSARGQPRRRVSDARHADGGRADDAAGRRSLACGRKACRRWPQRRRPSRSCPAMSG